MLVEVVHTQGNVMGVSEKLRMVKGFSVIKDSYWILIESYNYMYSI